MNVARLRPLAAAALSAVVAGALLAPDPAIASPVEPIIHEASGLTLVPPLDLNPKPVPAALAAAWGDAYHAAQLHPDDFGYPWPDQADNRLVLTAVSAKGGQLTAGLASVKESRVAWSAKPSTRTFAQLERIKDEATRLVGVLPDADLIFQTAPDLENNRVIITVARQSDALLQALAKRFGTEAIAIRVDETRPRPELQGRDNDTTAFWGGATLVSAYGGGNGCTTGFPWWTGSSYAMLTAGHCFPWVGTAAATPAMDLGYSAYDNWNPASGTELFPGDSYNRGDLALLYMNAGRASGPKIYRGGAGSYSSNYVDSMWSQHAYTGDAYCSGGRVTGEQCGWVVVSVYTNAQSPDDYTWAYNVNMGSRTWDTCTIHGDSGGPVYTVLGNGNVVAKGIHHGGSGGGADHWAGIGDPCYEFFTDIWEAWYYLPGGIYEI